MPIGISVFTTMSGKWHRMTHDDLLMPDKAHPPVKTGEAPKLHPEWYDYSGKNGPVTTRRRRR